MWRMLVLFFLAGALCAPLQVLAEENELQDCTWDNATYDEYGWLRSVEVFRGTKSIAKLNHMQGMDFYWVQCNGISKKEVFNTANDAAWAACWRCR